MELGEAAPEETEPDNVEQAPAETAEAEEVINEAGADFLLLRSQTLTRLLEIFLK